MSTEGEQVLKHYVEQLLYQPNRKTRVGQTTIKQCYIGMTKQLYTIKRPALKIPWAGSLQQRDIDCSSPSSLIQLGREVFHSPK